MKQSKKNKKLDGSIKPPFEESWDWERMRNVQDLTGTKWGFFPGSLLPFQLGMPGLKKLIW